MKRLVLAILLIVAINVEAQIPTIVLPVDKRIPPVAVKVAKSQVGVKEKTNRNDGKEVESYLKTVGLGKGNPYCQAGMYWSYLQATLSLGLDKGSVPFYRSGSTQLVYQKALAKGKRMYSLLPFPGDLLYWKLGKKYQGHVEMIVEIKSVSTVICVGFNTSVDSRGSQREGGGVALKPRSLRNPIGQLNVLGILSFRGM